jgi:REP element-mobilizing transposase RayT
VTLRRAKGLPSLRSNSLHRLLLAAVRDTGRARGDAFRIVHYSIQADHLHLIVEADDPRELSNGMRSFAIRIALRVNRLLQRRRGRVWGDRHHRRDLTSPSEVRNALVYLLSNHLKHGELDVGLVDPCSSGPWFEGWIARPRAATRHATHHPPRAHMATRQGLGDPRLHPPGRNPQADASSLIARRAPAFGRPAAPRHAANKLPSVAAPHGRRAP